SGRGPQGGASGGGPKGGWPCDSIGPRPSPFAQLQDREDSRGARGVASCSMSLANCTKSATGALHALRVWRVLRVGARALLRLEGEPHQLSPRAGLVDRRVVPPRNTDYPLCGRPVVRLGNEDRAAMR